MPNPTPIYYSDLIAPDSSITDAIAQLKELSAQYEASKAKIQSTAAEMAKGMQNVSGATEDQRQQIALAAKEADRLAAEMISVREAQGNVTRTLNEAAQANREYNQLLKLQEQASKSLDGSYNQLSAQYRILKIRINEMGEADEKAAKKKRELENQARALYARMNELQTATGKYTLQVGNYERALGGALGVSSKFIEVLQDSSKAGEMFHGVMSALTSPIGVLVTTIGLATGALKLWGSTIHETQVTGDAFDNAVAGWTSSWDYFKKAISEVDFTNVIRGMIDAARVGRELQSILDEMSERQGSIALQKAMMSDENAIRLERLRNTQLSNKERIAAGKEYLKAIAPIYAQEERAARDLMDAELNDLWTQANKRKKLTAEEKKISQEQLANYIINYENNLKQIRAAREYNKALAYPGGSDATTLFMAQHADKDMKALMDLTAMYDRLDNKRIKAYRQSAEDYYRLTGAYRNENRRIISTINSLEKEQANEHEKTQQKIVKDTKTAVDKVEEIQEEVDDKAGERAQREYEENVKLQRRILDLKLSVAEEGSEEYMKILLDRIELEREVELAANAKLAEEKRVDEELINAKYDAQALKTWEKYGTQAGEVVAESANKAVKKSRKRYGSIWDIIIPDTDDEETNEKLAGIREGIETFVASVMDSVSQLISLWKEEAEEAVKAADKQVDAAERVVDAEREAAANGYANNVRRAEMELALAKKTQEKALAEKEKANKAQMALETVMQATSLVTASANIWSSMSEIPIVGPALAIASIALMWGSFLATKIKAAQVTKESYGEGTVELLDGGSHASGHDISLGRKKDGTERRAEGGEFFAVINKRNSRRYRNEIPEVINAFNDGTFADKYMKASDGLAGYAVQVFGNADLSRLEGGVDAIRKQGEERHSIEGHYVVTRYKNLTRRVKV